MKKVYLILMVLCHSLFAKAEDIFPPYSLVSNIMEDSIFLTFGGGSADIGEEICIPLYGENFTDVIAFQWEVNFDPNVLAFVDLETHSSIRDLTFNSSEFGLGKIKMLHEDIERPISLDSLLIMELCFSVIGSNDVPTSIGISNDFSTEIVRSSLEERIIPQVISQNIFINNKLDCGLIPICPYNKTYIFSEGMVIHKRDFIESYEAILDCHNYKDEEVKLINMSAPGSLPEDSLIMTCENVFYNTTIGVVIVGTSTSITDGITTEDTASFLICQAHTIFNIPDNLENCVNTIRSCIDPLRCKTIGVNVTEPFTVIEYSSLVDSDNFSLCEANFYSNYESIAAIPDAYPDGFLLTCQDYKPELSAVITIEAQIAPNHFFIGEMCTSLIEMKGIDEVCENDSLALGEIPVKVNSDEINFIQINGVEMTQKGQFLYAMKESDILVNNEIMINEGRNTGLEDISTLDLVLQFKILLEEEYRVPEAIAADIDRSGSLTTKDIGILRRNILGFDEDEFLGEYFILERNQAIQDLDFLNFKNDFQSYQFSSDDLDRSEGLHFEIFKYGNLSSVVSVFHKSRHLDKEEVITVEDEFIKKGEVVKVPFTVQSYDDDPLVGMDIALVNGGFLLKGIDHQYGGNALLYNDESNLLKISFVDMNNRDDLSFILELEATKDGYLSDVLSIHDKGINEIVTDNLNAYKPTFQFENSTNLEMASVYPNPFNNVINITVPQSQIGATVRIYNTLGQLIMSEKVDEEIHKIDMTSYGIKGLLNVVLISDDKYEIFKVVTQ